MLGAQFAETMKEDVDYDVEPETDPANAPFSGEMADTSAQKKPGEASKHLVTARMPSDTKAQTAAQTSGRYT